MEAQVEERAELLIGCGGRLERVLSVEGRKGWSKLTTLDIVEAHKPDVIHDLERVPWPFDDDSFDEVHAYEVLEHLGQQGDWRSFFDLFAEIWRVLKPDGFLAATCPSCASACKPSARARSADRWPSSSGTPNAGS